MAILVCEIQRYCNQSSQGPAKKSRQAMQLARRPRLCWPGMILLSRLAKPLVAQLRNQPR